MPVVTERAHEPPGNQLLADDQSTDTDSAITDLSEASTTTSVTSSILEYRRENGRYPTCQYPIYLDDGFDAIMAHRALEYLFPNDDTENDRLDLQHHIFLLTLDNKLHLAPLKNPQNVLDIGTGTGIWAIEFADEYPSAQVTGTDLSPIQPTWAPPNCRFLIDDAEEDWQYPEHFDYIHGRVLTSSFQDPVKVFKEAYRYLKPGGYFEMQDLLHPYTSDDNTMPPSNIISKWCELWLEASKKLGKDLDQTKHYKKWMQEAGFPADSIQETFYKWPLNTWPKDKKHKELGLWNLENVLQGLSGFCLAMFTRGLGWTKEEVEVFLINVRKELKNTKTHGYIPVVVLVARKPENASD
ncbi:MAG: hypothetical protein M1834_002652 [Cirrosporium novae-zelandiae]|nr:MAG: hypothetical protein M1834_002652 [Cirrosporium novae-zelandiae]